MTASDIESCVAVLREHEPNHDADEWTARFGRDVADLEKHPVVALVDDVVVGYARTMPFEPDGASPADTAPGGYYLLGLVVASAHRRRGLGRLLTEERLQWVTARAAAVYYYTRRENIASQQMHERLGFRELTSNFWFPALPCGHSEVLYVLALPGPATAGVEPAATCV